MKGDYQNTEDSVLYLLIPQECFILSFSERSHFSPDLASAMFAVKILRCRSPTVGGTYLEVAINIFLNGHHDKLAATSITNIDIPRFNLEEIRFSRISF